MNSADEPTNDIIPTNDVVKLTSKQQTKEKNELIMKEVRLMDAEPYIDENTTLYHGDCLEMNKIQDDSVDLVLCDLPTARRNASGTP
jgi:hypothetical protein